MTRQVWKQAHKHRDARIDHGDWYNWWSADASCRNGLKMFLWRPEDARGLPTSDCYQSIDYTKGTIEVEGDSTTRHSTRSAKTPTNSRPESSMFTNAFTNHRKSSFCATMDQDGSVSRPVRYNDTDASGLPDLTTEEAMALNAPRRHSSVASRSSLEVPRGGNTEAHRRQSGPPQIKT
jgi:hypothetical protein